MELIERIESLIQLGQDILTDKEWISDIAQSAAIHNPWFTPTNTTKAITATATQFLSPVTLENWIAGYNVVSTDPKSVGLVLAGNIPMVGWHDIMCVFVSGHKSIIKYSAKDNIIIPALLQRLKNISPKSESYFSAVDRLENIDAVIATGGDTAATHFKHYFGKHPHIIRKNRSSIAVLSGDESLDDLYSLTDDIFSYFGLGCRSVSKIYVPQNYKLDPLFEASIKYADIIDHTKYCNNYNYNNAIYLLGQHPFLTNNFLIALEDTSLSSRISCLHYERYESTEDVIQDLQNRIDDLQCISSNMELSPLETVPLGSCQQPQLHEYADNVDTMKFLTQQI